MQCFCSLTLFVCSYTRVTINVDVPLENHITSPSLLLPSSLSFCLYRLFSLLLNPNSHILCLEASPSHSMSCVLWNIQSFSSGNGDIKGFMRCSRTESSTTVLTDISKSNRTKKKKKMIWNAGLWLAELILFWPMALALLWAANLWMNKFIEWIFLVSFWIEYWIEWFLSVIQCLNE